MGTILCYGDSNTWGFNIDAWSPTTPSALLRFPPDIRWPGVLAARLGPAHRVIEEGLNGRTTVRDDVNMGEHKNGVRCLQACLESHMPLDLVIIALGINDAAFRYSATARDIALGVARLARMVLASDAGPGGRRPGLLLVCPFPLGEGIGDSPFAEVFDGERGRAKSLLLAARYEEQARLLGVGFLDAGSLVKAHPKDSLHLTAEGHRLLGEGVARTIAAGGFLAT